MRFYLCIYSFIEYLNSCRCPIHEMYRFVFVSRLYEDQSFLTSIRVLLSFGMFVRLRHNDLQEGWKCSTAHENQHEWRSTGQRSGLSYFNGPGAHYDDGISTSLTRYLLWRRCFVNFSWSRATFCEREKFSAHWGLGARPTRIYYICETWK